MSGALRAVNPTSISVAPATRAIGRRYYDLPAILELMGLLWQESVVDGCEFQHLEEWCAEEPPRDEREKRFAAWSASPRYTLDEIVALLRCARLPILSVHAKRDVGICLCSGQAQDVAEGRRMMHESLTLAQEVAAPVCVFHLWDTWNEAFDPRFLQNVLREIAPRYPRVRASVENVPTHLAGFTPFELARQFDWITLDLQWAALYDELERFEAVKERIVNVHLRGRLAGGEWALDGAPYGFYEALGIIRDKWGYSGLLTLEPNELRGDWMGLVAAMATLRVR